jgi:hypothetical protein
MALPRLQLFEFNDHPRSPAPLRESLVESLSRALVWGRVLRGLAGPFTAFLDRTGADEVLDLCSGAGGPATILASEIRGSGRRPPRFLLTDLHPHPQLWEALRKKDPQAIDFVSEPVDATNIPGAVGAGRPRVIINALHHLPPTLAGEVLRGACSSGPGVFIAEAFGRNPLRFFPFIISGGPAILVNPFLSPRHGLAKFLLLPVSLVAGPWDGVVSTLRVYTERDLREMTAPLGEEFDWQYGTFPYPFGGKGYWFAGVRRSESKNS